MNVRIIYLIRHSEKFDRNKLKTADNDEEIIYGQKLVLSARGEEKAKNLSKLPEMKNIKELWSSNMVRAIGTAKYIAEENNLDINIDERFKERTSGDINKDKDNYSDFWLEQHLDKNLKSPNGESQLDVQKRMYDGIMDILKNTKQNCIGIVSHAAAMTFLLMKWCNLEYINKDKIKKLVYKNKEIINRKFYTPEIFKLTFSANNELLDIENFDVEEKL